jgi:hypothetical protein
MAVLYTIFLPCLNILDMEHADNEEFEITVI